MSKAAKESALQELHAALAKTFMESIDEVDENGKRNAAVLNAARQFLKDNGVACARDLPSQPIKDLAERAFKLPFEGTGEHPH